MAHEIETAMFVSTPAWHGLGTVLKTAPTPREAITTAKMAWRVEKAPMYLSSGRVVDGHYAMLRDSDGAQLGVTGEDFTVLQNVDAFDQFEPLVASGDVTIEAAGSLRGGKRVWILAAVKNATIDVVKNDPVKTYLLLAHGHDGSLAVNFGFTRTRVVCQNTLSMALGAKDGLFKFRHTSNVLDALTLARGALDMQRAELRNEAEVYRMLAQKKLSDKNLTRYIRETLKAGAGNDTEIKVRNVDKIVQLAHEGRGAMPGTLWGGFNAVTEFATHQRGKTADTRVDSMWFGSGKNSCNALVKRALNVAVAYAEKLPTLQAA